ncbi:hypothetical protein [Geobacter sp. AOG2]|uniref:hypothetical protein n=1 Tax=Geobacter sp. AOG2 TaxID=1566347 RepID=UPI001CC4C40C|nr:hypothetical protein [Geobacter sp. AOG2]GFE62859.1 hypothetical protein AOG2_34480 [Geobacter sp. AOG2]
MRHPDRRAVIPEPQRIAIHQAGHAVAQTLVGRRRFTVASVSIDAEPARSRHGLPAQGQALLDRETFLGLYEFGLVTLAGIAAEERYLAQDEPADDPVVALSDLAEWQEQAWDALQDEARVGIVSLNVMRKLGEWMADDGIWVVVEQVAQALLAHGTIQGEVLQQLLAPLEEYRGKG